MDLHLYWMPCTLALPTTSLVSALLEVLFCSQLFAMCVYIYFTFTHAIPLILFPIHAASWDGFEDQQSGLHVYQWWVGSTLGNDDIIPPTDPHMHLAGGQSSWTNSGLATGLALADGSYYISVQVHTCAISLCMYVCVCVFVCVCVCECMLYILTRDSI